MYCHRKGSQLTYCTEYKNSHQNQEIILPCVKSVFHTLDQTAQIYKCKQWGDINSQSNALHNSLPSVSTSVMNSAVQCSGFALKNLARENVTLALILPVTSVSTLASLINSVSPSYTFNSHSFHCAQGERERFKTYVFIRLGTPKAHI